MNESIYKQCLREAFVKSIMVGKFLKEVGIVLIACSFYKIYAIKY